MSDSEGRLYASLVVSVSALLLASALALGVLVVSAVIGPFELLRPQRGHRAVAGVWLPDSGGARIPGAAEGQLRTWRATLGAGFSVHRGGSLEELKASGVSVVIVPDARSLTDAEYVALESFLAAGGSAIATGAIGVTDPSGEWRGWQRMARLLGVEAVTPLAHDASAITAGRRGPLSAALAPGEQLALHAPTGAPAIDDPDAELHWAAGEGSPTRSAAGRRVRVGEGRLVWLGAGPERAQGGRAPEAAALERLLAAAYAWVTRQPFVEVDASAEVRRVLQVAIAREGPSRHLLRVTNGGPHPVQAASLRIHLNAPYFYVDVERTVLQQDEPVVRVERDARRVDLRLPELGARQSIAYTLDVEGPEEG